MLKGSYLSVVKNESFIKGACFLVHMFHDSLQLKLKEKEAEHQSPSLQKATFSIIDRMCFAMRYFRGSVKAVPQRAQIVDEKAAFVDSEVERYIRSWTSPRASESMRRADIPLDWYKDKIIERAEKLRAHLDGSREFHLDYVNKVVC